GWKAGSDGTLDKSGLKAHFAIYYNASDTTRQALALAAADMIRPLGIQVDVLGRSWDEIKQHMHSDVVLFGAGSPDPFETYNLYVGTDVEGGWWFNTGLYDNPVVKAHFAKGLAAKTLAEALPEWKAAAWDGKTGYGMKGDAAWAWLVNIDHVYFVSKCLDVGPRQVEPHGHGFPITYNLEDWRWTCN
ncbi:MAG: ABC transporter substrate-binding protein, partial [Phyllobacteriaceae bacterium]|nr:ABC transporter substrate-binding protein [Phyllobacteriaceae bacterium]